MVPVGVRHLLDDERHALGLRVHRGRAGRVHGAAEELLQQRLGLGLAEAVQAQTPDQPDALHVGDEVDRLGRERELLGTDREHEEDRARGVGAYEVAEQPQAVVVGPLEIVDEDRDRFVARGRIATAPRSSVRSSLASGGRGRESGSSCPVIASVHRASEASAGAGGGSDSLGRPDDRACHQERTAELLVAGHADRREPLGRRRLAGREQKPRLADPRLALQRHADEPARGGGGQLLFEGRLSAGRPTSAPGERIEGQRRRHCMGGRKRAAPGPSSWVFVTTCASERGS